MSQFKLNSEKSFVIFLTNLYYRLDCHDQDFHNILTNKDFTPDIKLKLDMKFIRLHLINFQNDLGYAKMNEIYFKFSQQNNIVYRKVS